MGARRPSSAEHNTSADGNSADAARLRRVFDLRQDRDEGASFAPALTFESAGSCRFQLRRSPNGPEHIVLYCSPDLCQANSGVLARFLHRRPRACSRALLPPQAAIGATCLRLRLRQGKLDFASRRVAASNVRRAGPADLPVVHRGDWIRTSDLGVPNAALYPS